MPRTLPLSALKIYLIKRHTRETQDKIYMFDMLWAMGTGRTFTDNNHNATYPRYHELIKPKKPEPISKITKADVAAQFARLKTKQPLHKALEETVDYIFEGI